MPSREGIGAYVPGNGPNVWQPGTAVYVPAGSRLLFELHYTPNGSPQPDRSMIGVRFADPKTVKKIVRCTIVNERALRIPPRDPNYEVTARHLFVKDTELLILWPHMHLRGKSFRFEAAYPDGTNEILLDVLNYDFNWQYRYLLEKPKLMPKGTTLRCMAHFDNSADNMANPDPNQEVTVGNATSQEMMQGNYYSLDAQPDAACIALVALAEANGGRAALAAPAGAKLPELHADELKPLFDLGAIDSTDAVAAAKARYDQLKSAHPTDRRIDDAYALALINQRQYAEASELLGETPPSAKRRSAPPALNSGSVHSRAHWARCSTTPRRSSDVFQPRSNQRPPTPVNFATPPASWARSSKCSVTGRKRPIAASGLPSSSPRPGAEFDTGQQQTAENLKSSPAGLSPENDFGAWFAAGLPFPYEAATRRLLGTPAR